MMKPYKDQTGGSFGVNKKALLKATIEAEKKRAERENNQDKKDSGKKSDKKNKKA